MASLAATMTDRDPSLPPSGTALAAPVPRLNTLPFRRLFLGRPPEDGRVFYHNIWFRGHNNVLAEGLLPRLARVDCYLATCSDRRVLRAAQFRALRAAWPLTNRVVLARAAKRYRFMLTHSFTQVPGFAGRVVAQLDDPQFTTEEVAHLSLPNVAAVVVTADAAVQRFRDMGLAKPLHVFPLGSEVSSLSEALVRAVADRHRRPGEVIVGYMAATLRLPGDRYGSDPLFNISHLLDVWDDIHAHVPEARLWLIGETSDQVERRAAARSDIVSFGRIPRDRVLPYVANFDVALYPRVSDGGVRSAKGADYLGAGVPTVAYDYRVADDLREAGAAVLVKDAKEMAAAVTRLVRHADERAALAAAARRAGDQRDWRVLAGRFDDEVLGHYFA